MLRSTRVAIGASRRFHQSALRAIAVGDAVPSTPLNEDAPSKTVNLADLTKSGKSLVVGVPGAYSPGCSQSHVPGYLKDADKFKNKGVEELYVIAVNDPFVTKQWKEDLLVPFEDEKGWLKVLADPTGKFSHSWGTLFDATKFFGNERSQRFAALIDNGKVEKLFVEPDNTGIDASAADKVLKEI